MGDDSALHPVVADLAAAMQRSPDQTAVAFPPEALERAHAQVRAAAGDDVVRDLVALAVKARRIAGDGAVPVVAAIGLLVIEKLGSPNEAADRLAAAGLEKDAAALIGGASELRAPPPREQPKAAPAPKPKRGLSR